MVECRACGSRDLAAVRGTELFAFCRQCLLVQRREKPGAAPVSPTAFGALERLIARHELDGATLVIGVDAAPLLEPMAAHGIPVLAVEQDRDAAARARAAGLPVIGAHFGLELADALASGGRRAALVLVPAFGRIEEPAEAAAAMARLVAADGTVEISFASAAEIVPLEAWAAARGEAILPTLRGLGELLEAEGLHLNDAGRAGRHHLMRASASTERRCTGRLAGLLEQECRVGADTIRFYSGGAPELSGARRSTSQEGVGATT